MKCARIGDKTVGDGHPCFISLEAGATHTGLESARMMVEAAAEAGADAVKFQTVMADELMSHEDVMIEYQTSQGKRSESVYQALKRRELSDQQWKELKAYCDELGILFISTPSGPATVDLLAEMNVAAIKVSKSDVNNRYLIKLIAGKGLPVIMDARERFEDVEIGVGICEAAGIEDIIIMHCPSGYPARYAGIHLRAIPHIKAIFDYPVAYSDHSVGDYMNYAALGVGANFLEKTITLDRSTDAVEHFMSLEPAELKRFVENIRNIEAAFGDPRIIFNSRVNATHRRSIITARPISKGREISIGDLAFKRPGTYMSVERYEEVLGSKATRDIAEGEFLDEKDFE
ncbi:MAG: N-acetylneuraminate synthase [Anaerolineaceae bacterium]|nr:N-acetylneuraminate synthase [Anaerolineaceae bacterium]